MRRHLRWRVAAVLAGAATVVALSVPGVAPAQALGTRATTSGERAAMVDAPGLTAGPLITAAGLVWERSGAIILASPGGSTRTLAAAPAQNGEGIGQEGWFGGGWWVRAGSSGVDAGRIGGALRKLALLSGCNPARPESRSREAGPQYAVANGHLLAAVGEGCAGSGTESAGAVIDIDLHSHRAHVLAQTPEVPKAIAAAGDLVAFAYGHGSGLVARVLDVTTGASVSRVREPPRAVNGGYAVQLDSSGDLLVSCCGEGRGTIAHAAQPHDRETWWWAPPGAKVGRQLQLGPDAALSGGRVAFIAASTGDGDPSSIELRNLRSGATTALVEFHGSAAPRGLDLSGRQLAWAQQSSVVSVVSGNVAGGHFESCTPVALSPVELARLALGPTGSRPVSVTGVPVPARYSDEPPCIES